MTTSSTAVSSPRLFQLSLRIDAASCALMGVALLALAAPIEPLLGLPRQLSVFCGLVLLPIAALMLLTSQKSRPPAALVWLVIGGNALWVFGSIYLWYVLPLTVAGQILVAGQALTVLVLAELEYTGWRRVRRAKVKVTGHPHLGH